MKTDRLTPRRARFVEEYLIDLNASAAAIRAGYSAKTASDIGRQLLRKTPVAAAIEASIAERSVRTTVDADRTLNELARIGFSDVRRLFTTDGRMRSIHEMDSDTAGSVASVKVVTRSLGDGEVEYIHEIKMWDKNSALAKIARHLGMLDAKLKVSGDPENPLALLIREIQGSALQPVINPPDDDGDNEDDE